MFDAPIDTKVLAFDPCGILLDRDGGLRAALAREVGIGGETVPALLSAREAIEQEIVAELEEFRPWREILAESLVRAAETVGLRLSPPRAAAIAAGAANWPPVPGVPAVLPRLAGRYRLAAFANADGADLAAMLSRMPVPFEHAVAADRVGCYLPEPDHLLALLHEMVVDEHEVLVVANHRRALEPAVALGIPAAWIDPRGASPPDDLPVLHRVRTLAELADRLQRNPRRRRGRFAGGAPPR